MSYCWWTCHSKKSSTCICGCWNKDLAKIHLCLWGQDFAKFKYKIFTVMSCYCHSKKSPRLIHRITNFLIILSKCFGYKLLKFSFILLLFANNFCYTCCTFPEMTPITTCTELKILDFTSAKVEIHSLYSCKSS